jgi:hypothetical protein
VVDNSSPIPPLNPHTSSHSPPAPLPSLPPRFVLILIDWNGRTCACGLSAMCSRHQLTMAAVVSTAASKATLHNSRTSCRLTAPGWPGGAGREAGAGGYVSGASPRRTSLRCPLPPITPGAWRGSPQAGRAREQHRLCTAAPRPQRRGGGGARDGCRDDLGCWLAGCMGAGVADYYSTSWRAAPSLRCCRGMARAKYEFCSNSVSVLEEARARNL